MDETLVDKVVNKLLKDNMTPAKIKAFAFVIQSLKGISNQEPNTVKEEKNDEEITEDKPINFSEVEGVQIDNQPREKVSIYA